MLTIVTLAVLRAALAALNAGAHAFQHAVAALILPRVWRTGVCIDCLSRADAETCQNCLQTVLTKRLRSHGCEALAAARKRKQADLTPQGSASADRWT